MFQSRGPVRDQCDGLGRLLGRGDQDESLAIGGDVVWANYSDDPQRIIEAKQGMRHP